MPSLTPQQLESLERRLRPGGASRSGFLTEGQSLESVLENNRRTVQSLGLTFAQFANRLEIVLGRTERMLAIGGRTGNGAVFDDDGARVVTVESGLRVRSWHFMGRQDCPFGDNDGSACATQPWSGADYELFDEASGTKVRVPGLLPHLVRAHAFFEGDVPYRVEPSQLARALKLEPGFRGEPQWRSERVWVAFSFTGATPWFGIGGPGRHWEPALMHSMGNAAADAPSHWEESFEIGADVSVRRAGEWGVVVVHRPVTLAERVRLDGSALEIAPNVAKGTMQVRRIERRYVALEGE